MGGGGIFLSLIFGYYEQKTDFCGREKLPRVLGTSGIPDAERGYKLQFQQKLAHLNRKLGRNTERQNHYRWHLASLLEGQQGGSSLHGFKHASTG